MPEPIEIPGFDYLPDFLGDEDSFRCPGCDREFSWEEGSHEFRMAGLCDTCFDEEEANEWLD
jgi:hypothetical protein